MPKPSVQKEYRHFGGGLITEASPLTFPENTAVDIDNMVLNYDGTVQRRKGIEETGANLQTSLSAAPSLLGSYIWRDAGGEVGNDYYVYVIGTTIYLHQCNGTTAITSAPTDSFYLGGLERTFSNVWGSISNEKVTFTDDGENLYVTQFGTQPFRITNTDTTTFTLAVMHVLVRDLDGVEDGVPLTEQPASFATQNDQGLHNYNLLNQGWNLADIAAYNTAKSVYPSNVQIPHVGWRPSTNTVRENWDANQVADYDFGSTPAPKGGVIYPLDTTLGMSSDNKGWEISNVTRINSTTLEITTNKNNSLAVVAGAGYVFCLNTTIKYVNGSGIELYKDIGLARVTAVSSAKVFQVGFGTSDFSSGFGVEAKGTVYSSLYAPSPAGVGDTVSSIAEEHVPTVCTNFAGRVWYSGIKGFKVVDSLAKRSHKGGLLLFSKLGAFKTLGVEQDFSSQECLQENSPSSREFNDLLDTDGGTVRIKDCGVIHKLLPVEKSLLVFASNGVWEIAPGALGYFTATSYSINKVSDIGVDEKESTVIADNLPFYKGNDGDFHVLSRNPQTGRFITQDLTETTIRTTVSEKTTVASVFDKQNKRVVWLNDDFTALVFDLRLKVWYKWAFKDSSNNTKLDLVYCPNLDSDYRLLLIQTDVSWNVEQFSFTNTAFEDEGVDAAAYVVTGYELLDASSKDKQATYITTHFSRTETQFIDDGGGGPLLSPQSGCQMKAQWDFDLTGDANRHSAQQQVYRLLRPYVAPAGPYPVDFDYGFNVITTKNKVRGKGKALALRFDSEAGKDMQLLGWSTSYTGNSKD